MTGEELDADIIAAEVITRIEMKLGPGAFEIVNTVRQAVSDVLASYGATREPQTETPDTGTSRS